MIRRKFLQLLGLGVASAPTAAKAYGEELSSLRHPAPLSNSMSLDGGIPACHDDYNPILSMNNYLNLVGKIPAFQLERLRERAKVVNYLDPDLAVKRSWSLSVKIQEQQERNYKREIERYYKMGKLEKADIMFSKATGFRWPW